MGRNLLWEIKIMIFMVVIIVLLCIVLDGGLEVVLIVILMVEIINFLFIYGMELYGGIFLER